MAATHATVAPYAATRTPLNSNQIKGFWAAWGGWCLDGMDAFIYSLVLVPALTELLPKSGIPATPANIGYYGSILFALFLAGWGMSMVWGPIADRFGRVKALMMTILMYSFFTLACGLVQNVYQLAILRVFCGIGLGGEQPIGGTFIAEEWPEDRRKMGAGYMHTGYYFGFFLAAIANYVIGANYGWRWMFVLGGTPALLVGWIQSGVHESAAWKAKFENPAARPRMRDSFAALFSPRFSKRTMTMSLLFMVSIIGLWAGSIYVPTAITQIAVREGHTTLEAARLASYAGAVLALGTIIGCLLAPVIAERVGRRPAMAMYYVLMFIGIAFGFGQVFYMQNALTPFFALTFVLGLGGANFALYTLWIPEQFTTECRGSAIGFTSSIGRFAGVAMVFLVGAGIQRYGKWKSKLKVDSAYLVLTFPLFHF